MINLKQGEVNTVFMDLYNTTTIDPVYYLFQFTNDSTNDSKVFTCTDVSTTVSAYNKFLIEETTSEDLTNGQLRLVSGQWTYKVYQSATSSLSLTYSTPAYNGEDYIAIGLVNVEEADVTVNSFTPTEAIKKSFKAN